MREYDEASTDELVQESRKKQKHLEEVCVKAIDSYIIGELDDIEETEEWGEVVKSYRDAEEISKIVRERLCPELY